MVRDVNTVVAALVSALAVNYPVSADNVRDLLHSLGTTADRTHALGALRQIEMSSARPLGSESVATILVPSSKVEASAAPEGEETIELSLLRENVDLDQSATVEVDSGLQAGLLDPAFLDAPMVRMATRVAAAGGEVYVSDDSLRDHLRRISRGYLLRAEDEVRLATVSDIGVLAQERLTGSNELSRADRRRYRDLVDRGQAAFDAMVFANLRLVVSIAKRHTGHGLEMLDLVQEGSIGLLTAVKKFDVSKGFKFSTYATWWIRQSITRAIADKGRTIRIPVHIHEKLSKLRRVQSELEGRGLEATVERLARHADMSVASVKQLIGATSGVFSYDVGLGDDNDTPLLDLLTGEQHAMPRYAWDIGFRDITRDLLGTALSRLKEKDRHVVILRFGLDGSEARTLEEIGVLMGVTRERIRQIEKRALPALRSLLESDDRPPKVESS